MKAVVADRYGPPDVLRLVDIDPPAVADGEVLVRVRAASVHPDVWHTVRGRPAVLRLMGNGLRRPKHRVPGTDMAGVVESAGRRFRPGDEVFGETIRGHQWRNGGAYAEYVSVLEDALARKPAGLTFEQAAAVPTAGFIALSNLRGRARPQPGHDVLVNGAGGGVGMLAVQIAKAYGARVTGVDGPAKLELMRSIGADRVLDHTRELPSLDFSAPGRRETMDALAGLIEAGSLTTVVDRTFPLDQVPDAIRYLESGSAVGRIVITVP